MGKTGREFEERQKLRPKSSPAASESSFASFEDDDPSFEVLDTPVH
jgi:hypothetical protein